MKPINNLKIFASSKVNSNRSRIEAYIDGKQIYPTTIELDLTQICSRSCPGCPYSCARQAGLTLQIPFLSKLFSILGPHTPGLVLSGGEPTIVPHFPETVALAKNKGFKEIAVISNGENIHLPEIQKALMEHVTSIRISLYDWQEGDSESFHKTLKKIKDLRNRIDSTGSKLEIGASILTRSKCNHRYESVGLQALDAGIHWLYFHPYCINWDQKYPIQDDQSGVIEAIARLKENAPENSNIQVPYERYSEKPLEFDELHGSHFLIQVGADGINYAGPECKYEKEFELLDLNDYMEDDFLWHPRRLERLKEINSDNYRFIGTRHRPPMFSDYIQKLIQFRRENEDAGNIQQPTELFCYPNII